jgi:hypothetical protein
VASLGKYVTETNNTAFAISIVLKDLLPILSRTNCRSIEIVTKSRSALIAIHNQSYWEVQTITDAKRLAKRVEEVGGILALT